MEFLKPIKKYKELLLIILLVFNLDYFYKLERNLVDMDLQGGNLETRFVEIINEYKLYPHIYRLYKSGRPLKIFECNGLMYMDTPNLFNVMDELLGPNVPSSLFEYLDKIMFSERLTIETNEGIQNIKVTCIQFIDKKFFDKVIEWIADRPIIKFYEYNHFDYNNIDTPKIPTNNATLEDKFKSLENIFPFKYSEDKENQTNEPKKSFVESLNTLPMPKSFPLISKPRGKNMGDVLKDTKDRPFICTSPFCDRAFKRHEHLKRHMKMHSGERPFKCPYPNCLKSFSRSDNLNQHCKTHNIGYRKEDFSA